jgi:transcription elongation GreA/GreB family factor/very-short-patch-repair endonuclease
MSTQKNILDKLIRTRIENIRPKLLDLSRRNPLVSAKLTPRSNSIVRVVDELPDVLLFNLHNRKRMCFEPLPPLEADPKDEVSRKFQEAFSKARLIDEQYSSEMGSLDLTDDESIEHVRSIERSLRDRVRLEIGLPPRQTKNDISLKQHARNNDISPAYDLPLPSEQHDDGRHQDDLIQTLLLPETLERRLNALLSKYSTWIEETGINVLHAAFGFLEWSEPSDTNSFFAPLVLLEVKIEKEKTRHGARFWVNSLGEDPHTNLVLAQKLRTEFEIEIPQFEGGSIEEYLTKISVLSPKSLKWRIRRQVAFGVFPSSRVAMYNDLDTSKHAFEENPVVARLLGGVGSTDATPFADELDVDHAEIERKVPHLVLDADSSQFSAIVDAMDEKNIALEGPPGTGKSQTIVNTIAAAIAAGKKVLFVSAKTAALEVVKARLEAVGLGEFLLPLQAERSNRAQVIQSIRRRLDIEVSDPTRKLDNKIAQFHNARSKLSAYIQIISSGHSDSGYTVYDVLGKNIALDDLLLDAPQRLQTFKDENLSSLDSAQIEERLNAAAVFRDAVEKVDSGKKHWDGLGSSSVDRFTADSYCRKANESADLFKLANSTREALKSFKLDPLEKIKTLLSILETVESLAKTFSTTDLNLATRVAQSKNAQDVFDFSSKCLEYQKLIANLGKSFEDPVRTELSPLIRQLIDVCRENSIYSLSRQEWSKELDHRESLLEDGKRWLVDLEPFISVFPRGGSIPVPMLQMASEITHSVERSVLELRNETNSDPRALPVLRQVCERGASLVARKNDLEKFVSTSIDTEPNEIMEHVGVLRDAGLFPVFFSSFRRAKRAYLAHSRRAKFDKTQASADFASLAALKRDTVEYCDGHQAKSLFGIHFDGLNTPFQDFETLVGFLETVEQRLTTEASRSLREFLRTESPAVVQALPDLAGIGWQGSFEELGSDLESKARGLKTLNEALETIETAVSAIGLIRSLAIDDLEHLAESVDQAATLRRQLETDKASDTTAQLLGDRFAGTETDIGNLDHALAAVLVLQRDKELMDRLIEWTKDSRLGEAEKCIRDVIDAERTADAFLFDLTEETGVPFAERLTERSHSERSAAMAAIAKDRDGIFNHAKLKSARSALEAKGIAWIAKELEDHQCRLDDFPEKVEAVIFRCMAMKVYEKHGGVLSMYSGTELNKLRSLLAECDRKIILLSREKIAAKTSMLADPPQGNGTGRKSSWTEMSLIMNELSKKQRFISARALSNRAGRALRELKPCWMLSPLAVAQYLPVKQGMVFDLCIIDEASQMPPEDAIGAIARSKQVMVAGDTNQLPPTSFFRKLFDDEDTDEDETVLEESILEMANSAFRPGRRLRWHYRSRNSSLIKFSNHYVYDDDLIVFPSANENNAKMGVKLVAVEGCCKAGVNAEEASAIVEGAIRFMHEEPDRSLGIVTLNQKQRDLVSEELEYALSRDSTASKYVDTWKEKKDGLEAFFVKNLENVQGDERDVIFIGTVYGPEKLGGPIMQRFGPINGLAGKRRLNVLFSRAKQKIVTYSSMSSSDVRADENANQGVHMLKQWLEYSATGLLHQGSTSRREPDSDFEVYVANQITAIGCEAVPQVGVAGYFVDIGVKHPQWPHGFIMGVECDGATYHSSRSARDRDRLREEVLNGLGWHLHRIWSTDWFNDPSKEAERLHASINQRLDELRKGIQESGEIPTEQITSQNSEDIFVSEEPNDLAQTNEVENSESSANIRIEVGDRVRVRYLSGDKKDLDVQLTSGPSAINEGLVNASTPLGEALLGAEEQDEVEVLVGNQVRKATVSSIEKNKKRLQDKGSHSVKPRESKPPKQVRVRSDEASAISPGDSFKRGHLLDPERFYESSYLSVIRDFASTIIDEIGPATEKHIADLVARAHGFRRTGPQIRRQIKTALRNVGHSSKQPDGEIIRWASDASPSEWIPFRGLDLGTHRREWKDVPYPEKLGLAKEILHDCSSDRPIDDIAASIGLSRLHRAMLLELQSLIEAAEYLGS